MATAKPKLLTESGASLDLDDPIAVEAATGRPVLLCATLRATASGRVVDARTGDAVSGARLTVESWRASPPLIGRRWTLLDRVLTRTFTSDTDGAFDIPTEAAWMPGILTADALPVIVQRTCVTAPGYEALVYEPSLDTEGGGVPERVKLHPASDPGTPSAAPCEP